jgi:filamentous hemagglutinin family protein
MGAICKGTSQRVKTFLGAVTTGLLTSGMVLPAIAQVTSDRTTNTTVTANGNNFKILNGIEKGNNLFHSFSNFSVPTGGSASFDLVNTPNITTIFSRVTGSSVSNIDGLIRTLNSSNSVSLFLMNPNGIIFGQNAKLDIGGSFVGTTANSIKFPDGIEFSAVNPTVNPLLTMSIPVGLQMGSNPGAITVQGKGHNGTDAINGFFVPRYPNVVNPQLQLQPGNMLGLIGGSITLNGATMKIPDGRAELGSVQGNQFIPLSLTPTGFMVNYAGVKNFQDIHLTQSAIDVSGSNGGGIYIQARQVGVKDGSELLAHTLGTNGIGKGIVIRASESLELLATQGTGAISSIMASVQPGASGKGGDITIETPNFRMAYGALFRAELYGRGQSGNVTFQTQNFEMVGADVSKGMEDNGTDLSIGLSGNRAVGNGGTLTIASERVRIANGARLRADMLGRASGQVGDINVQAAEVEISGIFQQGASYFNSWISSTVERNTVGQAGNITLNSERIRLTDSGAIRSDILGSGNGGTVTLRATDIEIAGFNETIGRMSRVSSRMGFNSPNAVGNGGSVVVNTQQLKLRNGGQIGVSTFAKGSAGNLTVNASESIEVIGAYLPKTGDPVASGLQAIVDRDAVGKGGNITVVTPKLNIMNGGEITAAVFGNGDAGNIAIQAATIAVGGKTANGFQPSRITATTNPIPTKSTGAAGSITMQADQLTVKDGAEISVSGQQLGEAGNLTISAGVLRLDNAGSLRAEVLSGSKGNITINADATILRRGSQITTNAGANANGGDIKINSPLIVGWENSDIIANALTGRGGNIEIATQGIFGLKFRNQLTPENDITASSQFGVNGTVNINNFGVDPSSGLVELPVNLVDSSQQIATGCSNNTDSSFVATGRGGIPLNPNQQVTSERTWSDIRDLSAYRQTGSVTAQIPQSPETLIQATSWHRNAQGKIELIADKSSTQLQPPLTCAAVPKS